MTECKAGKGLIFMYERKSNYRREIMCFALLSGILHFYPSYHKWQ